MELSLSQLRGTFVSFAFAVLLVGCGGAPSDAPKGTSATPSAHPSKAGVLVATNAQGQPAYTLTLDGSHAEVTTPDGVRYVGEQKGDKRKWRRADGSAFAEVKAKGDDDFKLRTPDAVLLWKVKLTDDKIKVSDNEENRNPFVLKLGYEDKAKILAQDESEIGAVKFYGDKTKVKSSADAELFFIDTQRRSAAWGVLAMDDIPEAHRAIIAAEIMARHK